MRVLRLRLEIEGLTPAVWRALDITSDIKLSDLHLVIQAAMGWRNEYPACFFFASTPYSIGAWPQPGKDASSQSLDELCAGGACDFFYDYEPDEPWRVRCRVESERLSDTGEETLPACIGGERAAPPDGVGGREGYADFLRMLADPEADEEEIEDMLEWAGGDFDPDAFDLAAVTRRLKKFTL